MTVTIRPDDEQLIAEVIRTGAYQNADEVIARALEVLRSDEEWLGESKSAIGGKNRSRLLSSLTGDSFSQPKHRKPTWKPARRSGCAGSRLERIPLRGFSRSLQDDLFEIWKRIAGHSVTLADRIDGEFHELFTSSGRMPGQGHRRVDLTSRPVLFFTHSSSFISLTCCRSRIMAVLRGRRNLKSHLKKRL